MNRSMGAKIRHIKRKKRERDMELKPCPFCGKAGWAGQHPRFSDSYIAHCTNTTKGRWECLYPSTGPQKTLKKAMQMWNTRVKGEKK